MAACALASVEVGGADPFVRTSSVPIVERGWRARSRMALRAPLPLRKTLAINQLWMKAGEGQFEVLGANCRAGAASASSTHPPTASDCKPPTLWAAYNDGGGIQPLLHPPFTLALDATPRCRRLDRTR
jgi:hypothetical protein